jgi:ABC-type lipoprotein release transport system permease subunit
MSNVPIIIGVVTLVISISIISSLIILFKPKQDEKSKDCDK